MRELSAPIGGAIKQVEPWPGPHSGGPWTPRLSVPSQLQPGGGGRVGGLAHSAATLLGGGQHSSAREGRFVDFKVLGVPFDPLSDHANNLTQDFKGWLNAMVCFICPWR